MPIKKQSDTLHSKLLQSSDTVSFADVAHQMLLFHRSEPADNLILQLIDTAWVQRLRNIRQTGNTHLVYMFAEHSRFGHSLGVAYLANMLMKNLLKTSAEQVRPYQTAVAAAALLHDIGHVAPGSHLAEHLWGRSGSGKHEAITARIIREDAEIHSLLKSTDGALPDMVAQILSSSDGVPSWTKSIISGGGWNADRGNWAIVDSAMCSVAYGRYNVTALLDAFRLSPEGELVLQENRLDALTHFFVARDSMYRQVYQHRVLQAADALTEKVVLRLRDIIASISEEPPSEAAVSRAFAEKGIPADAIMQSALLSENYGVDLPLETLFQMTESWWRYHLDRWCFCLDPILKDLSIRLRDRRLLKTVRYDSTDAADRELFEKALQVAADLGYDPRYYIVIVKNSDMHRSKVEKAPLVLLDNGEICPITTIEPMTARFLEKNSESRAWIAMPKEVKAALGRIR